MNDLIIIDPKQYGLEKTKADEIAEAFREPLADLATLETEYKDFENLTGEPPKSTCAEAKTLQQKYVKNRKSREAIHKTEKSYFLNAGRYVDAWKNKSLEVSKEREDKLKEIADYHVNLEKARIEKLGESREIDLRKCQLDDEMYIPPALGEMPEEAWTIYLEGVQKKYDEYQEEQRKAEIERAAKEKAEKEEQERIRKENEQLRAEAEAKEKAIAKERKATEAKQEKERLEREKIEAERQAVIDAEREEQEKKLAAERAEREKLEQEKKDKEAAEAKANADEEEAQRKAAAAPDKEKLISFIEKIGEIKRPELSTNAGAKIIDSAMHDIGDLIEWIKKETEAL